MTLVGDIIVEARELMTDPCQVQSPPTCGAIVMAVGGSTLPAGNYYVVETYINNWGETVISNEIGPLNVAAGQGIVDSVTLPTGVLKIRMYLTAANGSAGGEQFYVDFLPANIVGGVITVSAQPTNAGTPPLVSSAWLPDTDGSYLRASTTFRWLSDGLRQGSLAMGGLIDYSGFPATPNYGTFLVQGEWRRMIQAWYEGYPVSFAPPSTFFKRNSVTASIMAGWDVSFYNGQMAVEVWPQPQRTPAVSSLTAPMAATDIIAPCLTGGFLLPTYGMAQIGTEIVMYNALNSVQLSGLIRGVGGTIPQAWPAGTQVLELNAFFQGRRIFNTQFVPGNSLVTLSVPAGFDGVLVHFLMSKYYATEKDGQSSAAELKEFKDSIRDILRQNRNVAGPQQVGSRDYQFITYGGTEFGRNVIP